MNSFRIIRLLQTRVFRACLAILLFNQLASQLRAETPYDADPLNKVQIDWRVEIGNVDDAKALPQISLIMSPIGDLSYKFSRITLNHRPFMTNQEGGWSARLASPTSGGSGTVNSFDPGPNLAVNGETIRVTQELSISEGTFWGKMVSLQSTTWGSPGGGGAGDSSGMIANLNYFDVNVSAQYSGVDAGKNKVARIVIESVRLYHDSGIIDTINCNQDVHIGLVGTAITAGTLNSDGTVSTSVPIDQATIDAVELETGF